MKQIAIAGKGGVGKTTFTALMLRHILKNKANKTVLAVDADPNANLNEALGLEVEDTISTMLEETKKPGAIPTGMTKEMFIEYKLQQALVETKSYDLLVMGNPQGSGCYCYPNDLLRKHLETLRDNYDYVTVDNEAGLEHLSRRIINNVHTLIVVSDASARSIRSAGRVHEIVKNVKLDLEEIGLVVTKVTGNEIEDLQPEIDKTGLKLLGTVPLDPLVAEYDVKSKALVDLPDDALSVQAVEQILNKINL
ncbi:ATP-binding protein [Dethiobacter alkaliphilus]|uniref:Cobyrinic acid ac-diamide synthase n=1 Tax=Dethiobacter alkaliphilus AHT 1 TaxID=555088 RepID=C0GF67_DETAL|nr:AAA family ATPase [Dethiobacter alkaliphilus]EEG77827.1 Cobyrinic acid ac-diamide synthase [Dethiobacter alkaliphilus AHT 1]